MNPEELKAGELYTYEDGPAKWRVQYRRQEEKNGRYHFLLIEGVKGHQNLYLTIQEVENQIS